MFACPGCGADIDADPEDWALRCPACGALLRCRSHVSEREDREYQVEVVGRPETRRRIIVPWNAAATGRLRFWLTISSLLTIGCVLALLLLARCWR